MGVSCFFPTQGLSASFGGLFEVISIYIGSLVYLQKAPASVSLGKRFFKDPLAAGPGYFELFVNCL